MKLYPTGTRIGQYEVVKGPAEDRKLMGGMGLVYLCIDRGNGDRPVALKTFQPQFLPHRAARERFLREGSAWVQLGRHPHIVQAHGVAYFDRSQTTYLVLEQIASPIEKDGASLRAWLKSGQPLPLRTSLLFGLQIARGMAHAVEVLPGFVHRDLKPENVLVGVDRLPGWEVNRLRVTDFGLATVLTAANEDVLSESAALEERAHVQHTQLTRGWVGTPLYMAPEQWEGQIAAAATDIYAFGLIFYEMLAGQNAVSGTAIANVKQDHQNGNLRPIPMDLPSSIARILRLCLARNAENRYATWTELTNDLENVYAEIFGKLPPPPINVDSLNTAEKVALGWANNSLGLAYQDIGKVKTAVSYFERAKSVGQEENEGALLIAGLGNLGIAYTQLGMTQQAFQYLEQWLALSQEVNDRSGESKALVNLGIAYFQQGRIQSAIDTYQKALALVREIGSGKGESEILGNLGNAYFVLGNAQQALDYYQQDLALVQNTGNPAGQIQALGSLGIALLELGNAQQAINYFSQALEIAKGMGDRANEGKTLDNLGIAYWKLGDAQRAIAYHKQALLHSREAGDLVSESRILGNLGNAYRQQDDLHQAIDYYQQQLAITQKTQDKFGETMAQYNMALVYWQLGETARALSLAEVAARQYMQLGHREYAQRAQEFIAYLQGRR